MIGVRGVSVRLGGGLVLREVSLEGGVESAT